MTPSELAEWRARYKFSQAALASTLGVTRNTVGRWERGEWPIPQMVPYSLAGIVINLRWETAESAR